MSRIKLWLLTIAAALLTLSLVGAPSASAKIAFQWKVGGKTLTSSAETRAFTSSTDGKTFDLHAELDGLAILLLSNKVTVTGKIIGGTPGTNEEKITFENVVVDSPKGCTAETGGIADPTPGIILTGLLKSVIVEGETSKEPLIFFGPVTQPFFEIKFLKKGIETCPTEGAEGAVEGSILAQPLPALTETLNGDLDFEAPAQSFLLSSGGNPERAGLTFAGEPLTVTGLLLNILTTDEKYGAF